jgi:signal transduction histidine kinase
MENPSFTEDKKIELFIEKHFNKKPKRLKQASFNNKKLEQQLIKSNSRFNDILEIKNLFCNSKGIHQFMQSIFSLKSLKSFSRIQLLVHEKGQLNSLNYEYTKLSNFKKSQFKVDIFSELFNSIKKSKERSFGEINLKGMPFDILGTFLAHEFSFKFHSVIILITRDDFLPQNKSDKDSFLSIVELLKIYLEPLVETLHEDSQIRSIQELLNKALYKFQYYKNDSLNFTNSDSFLLRPSKFSISQGEYVLIDLDNSQLLDHADIFHQERVNLLGDLFNTLKHELSNPLFGLQLSSELLLLEELDEEQMEFMTQINLSIKKSQELIENFKDLYSSELEYKDVNVLDLIKEVMTLTKSRSRNLSLNFICNHETLDIDNIIINTNSTWLAQIFFNFIINTSEACEDISSAKLDISFSQLGKNICINFMDNGPGISKELVEEIFKPFYTTKERGTGLGLSICKSLSSKLGGELKYIQTSKGASFDLLLPYENTNHRR